jgi:hypothetical protein
LTRIDDGPSFARLFLRRTNHQDGHGAVCAFR